jgi:hypothetical protein
MGTRDPEVFTRIHPKFTSIQEYSPVLPSVHPCMSVHEFTSVHNGSLCARVLPMRTCVHQCSPVFISAHNPYGHVCSLCACVHKCAPVFPSANNCSLCVRVLPMRTCVHKCSPVFTSVDECSQVLPMCTCVPQCSPVLTSAHNPYGHVCSLCAHVFPSVPQCSLVGVLP